MINLGIKTLLAGFAFLLANLTFAGPEGGSAAAIKFVPNKDQPIENQISGRLYVDKNVIANVSATFKMFKDADGKFHEGARFLEISSLSGTPIAVVRERRSEKRHSIRYQILDSNKTILLGGKRSYLDPSNTDTSIKLYREQTQEGEISFARNSSKKIISYMVLSQPGLAPVEALYSLLIFDRIFYPDSSEESDADLVSLSPSSESASEAFSETSSEASRWSKKTIAAGVVTGAVIAAGVVIYYNPQLLDTVISPDTRAATMNYLAETATTWYSWIKNIKVYGGFPDIHQVTSDMRYPALPMVPGQTEELCPWKFTPQGPWLFTQWFLDPCRKLVGENFLRLQGRSVAEWFSTMKIVYWPNGRIALNPQ